MPAECKGFHTSDESKKECVKVLERALNRTLKDILGSNYDFLVNLCRKQGYTKVEGLYADQTQ